MRDIIEKISSKFFDILDIKNLGLKPRSSGRLNYLAFLLSFYAEVDIIET